MKIILNHWLQSFLLFSPLKFKAFFITSIKRFFSALKTVMSRFGILMLIDILLFVMFGNVIFKTLHLPLLSNPANISISLVLVLLFIEVNWFIFSTTMLLFVRKKDNTDPLVYLKASFFAYLQLLILFYFLIFIGMAILIALGITKLPQVHWILLASHAVLRLLISFYWLDSPKTLPDVFLACEKAINCFIYNLPIFIFFIAIVWGLDACFKAFCGDAAQTLGPNSVFFLNKTEQIIKACSANIILIKFLALRYSLFFIKYLWTSFIFVFYDQKKGIAYSTSCLDALKTQPPL